MRTNRGLVATAAATVLALCAGIGLPHTGAAGAGPGGYAALANRIEAGDIGLRSPTGLSYSTATGELIVLDRAPSASVSFVTSHDTVNGVATLGAVPGDAINLAYDATRGRLAELTSTADLVSIPGAGRPHSGSVGLSHRDIRALGLRSAAGLATDASGALYILDAAGQRIVRLAPDAAGQPDPARSSVIGLNALAGARVRGLAVQRANGHLFVLASSSKKLYELDATGALVATRDLTAVGLHNPQGLVIAPSSDNTDPAAVTNLYVADAGTAAPAGSTGAGIAEIALTAPVTQAALLAAPTTAGSVVNTIITRNPPNAGWTPDSPDPSDLAFNADSGRLILSDGEVEETTGAGFHGVNGWEFSPTGTVTSSASFDTTVAPYTNTEPAGVAYRPGSLTVRRVFVSNDSRAKVQEVRADSQGHFYQANGLVAEWSTLTPGSALQSLDSEGIDYGVANGSPTLFIADGKEAEIWIVQPGANGRFEGSGDDVVTHFDTLSLGQPNPEDVTFDARDGTLWVISNKSASDILHVDTLGNAIETIQIASNPFVAPGGITLAPASSGGGMSLYVADRGIDNNPLPTENDGRIFEIAVASGGSSPTPTPTASPTPTPTPTPSPTPRPVARIAGTDRYGTAAKVSQNIIPNPGTGVASVYVATGTNFADALAGGPAAAKRSASLLLVTPSSIPATTAAELNRLKPDTIYILGGTGAVSTSVASQLAAYARSGTVIRLSGPDRYGTAAAAVANAFTGQSAQVMVATGEAFPDALAGGGAASRAGMPILLVKGTSIPAATAQQLTRLQPATIYVLGGTGAVSSAVESQLHAYAGTVIRVAGADRYRTAVAVSQRFFSVATGDHVWVSTGLNFPDALAAGPAGDSVLLTPAGSLPAAAATEIGRLDPALTHVLGGTSVVSNAVMIQISAIP